MGPSALREKDVGIMRIMGCTAISEKNRGPEEKWSVATGRREKDDVADGSYYTKILRNWLQRSQNTALKFKAKFFTRMGAIFEDRGGWNRSCGGTEVAVAQRTMPLLGALYEPRADR
jgi:hypothetical protein